ncbi:MAG: DUF4276 family protein [Bosea sp. (in: a-proteobacteria)]
MKTIYVLTEEASAERLVANLAPRVVPNCHVIPVLHSGKRDLCQSFPRKMRAIRHPADASFIVLHDNDGGDCARLKGRLLDLVPAEVFQRAKIRIVMQELESWYLGQMTALVGCELITSAQLRQLEHKIKFRDPDRLANAKQEFYKLHGRKNQQITLAELIAPHLDVDANRSASFKLFVRTLREFSR